MAILSENKAFREILGFKKAADDWKWQRYIMLYETRWSWAATMPYEGMLYTIHSGEYILLNNSQQNWGGLHALAEIAKPLFSGGKVCTKRTIYLKGMYIEYDAFEDKDLIEEKLKCVDSTFGFDDFSGPRIAGSVPHTHLCIEIGYLERLDLLSQGVYIIDWKVL